MAKDLYIEYKWNVRDGRENKVPYIEEVKATFKDAAKKLTGYRKRDFMAKVAEDYFEGSARKAETVMGRKRTSVNLEEDIKELVDSQSQADPKMQSTFAYTQISVRAVRKSLMSGKGYEKLRAVSF